MKIAEESFVFLLNIQDLPARLSEIDPVMASLIAGSIVMMSAPVYMLWKVWRADREVEKQTRQTKTSIPARYTEYYNPKKYPPQPDKKNGKKKQE